jgi:4-hydroxy-tetrahydrodipicolinate reductase
MVSLAITGVCGKMGSTILRLALADSAFQVRRVLEKAGHPLAGKSADLIAGPGAAALVIEDDFASALKDAHVVIDFTEPLSSLDHFRTASAQGKGIVIGTTGFSAEARAEILATRGAKAVLSPNMSIGVNLLFALVEKAALLLGPEYDSEIVEMHHKWKKDAPSGTAAALKQIIEASQPDKEWMEVAGRTGMWGERKGEELGIFSVRGGDTVGEHTVMFMGIGERVEITHRAFSRENFARGALRAARWLVEQEAGIYDMRDVLGLTA